MKAPARREEKQDARKQSETQGCKKRMLLKVNSKATFSEVVKLMKQNLDPAEMHVDVSKMQRSRSGNVLFRVKGEAGLETFEMALQEAVAGSAELATLEKRRIPVEIRDMDILAEVKDVQEALREFFGDTQERQVFVIPANRRGNRLAVATLVRDETNLLLGAGALRVGFVRCRVRKRIEVVKCFRCLGYAHISQDLFPLQGDGWLSDQAEP